MAPHDGAAQAEERSPLRLPNKIADSDPKKNHQVRQSITGDVKRMMNFPCFIQNMSVLTTLLPPHWKKLPPELKYFVEKEMFDPVMRQVLEDDNIINWAPSATKLYPLITTGDGNCLLHAISLAMWGVEDEHLLLRHLLHEFLETNDLGSRRRWQRERKKLDERIPGSGLRYNTMEWRNEWDIIIKMATPERQTTSHQALPYQSLEEFHVFIMANILRRPIIVMAQPSWHDLQGNSLQPQNFSGIYLPLKWKPEECSKQPIIIGYYQMHFVPLVYTGVMEGEIPATDYAIPLISRDHTPMEIHFLNDEEMGKDDELLQEYFALEDIPHMDINESMASAHVIRGAQLSTNPTPDENNLMVSYFKLVESHYRFYLETEYNPQSAAAPGIAAGETKLVDKMSKVNIQSSPQSDMWTPALNPHYKSNVPTNMQAYPGVYPALNELSPRSIEGGAATANDEEQQVIHSMINQGCATEGCQYYRSVSTGEYCHECYNKRKALSTREGANNMGSPVMCHSEGCMNPSVAGPDDQCQVCLDTAKFKGNTAPSAPLPSHVGSSSAQQVITTSSVISPRQDSTISPANPYQSGTQHVSPRQDSTVSPANPYQSGTQHSNVSEDELTTLVVNTVRVGSKKCIMPECQLTGHPDTSDMCQKCFDENRRIHENVMAANSGGTAAIGKSEASPPQGSPQRSSEAIYHQQRKLCRTPGCKGLGNPHIEGYCAQCGIKSSLSTENRPQTGTSAAMPQIVPPPDYSQAMKIIKGHYNHPSPQQTGYAAGYTASTSPTRPINTAQNRQDFTVPKHICPTPGCSGIRLDSGYCWECVRKNNLKLDPPRTRTPPPTPRQSWVQTVPRSQTPPLVASSRQPLGQTVPRSQTPPLVASSRQPLKSSAQQHGYPAQPTPANRPYQSATGKTGSMSTRMCRHPKCDRPAAPPKYILCEECIRIAELYKQEGEDDEPFESRHGSQPILPPAGTAASWNERQQPYRNQGMERTPFGNNQQNAASLGSKHEVYIKRQKCRAPGGCKDEMFGDPEKDNLCSSCYKDSKMRHPFQRPGDVYSAPLKPSPRLPQRPSSHSQELPKPMSRQQASTKREIHIPSHNQAFHGNQVIIAGGSSSPAMVQAGQVPYFQSCATPDCQNPANPNILEGYCNHCYKAYNDVFTETNQEVARPLIAQPAARPLIPQPAVRPLIAQPAARREEPYYLEQRGGAVDDQAYRKRGEPVGQVTNAPSAKPVKIRCKNDWCDNYGNPRSLGYCNECYELTQMCK